MSVDMMNTNTKLEINEKILFPTEKKQSPKNIYKKNMKMDRI